MESRTAMFSSLRNTAWECDDPRHGCDAAATIQRLRTTTESPVSSIPPSSDLAVNNYDVFLSFRGPDTRKGFADFLYQRFTDAGIHVFRDEEELPVGEPMKPALIGAIKQSKVLIPIISGDYASSRSCLMELVQILECKRKMSRETIPIFYEIELLDLKEQRNSFEKSFFDHRRNGVDCETVQEWKLALKEIGRLKGFETAKIHNGHYSKLIEDLIPIVYQKLKKGRLLVTKHLVGVDHHVQEIMRMLGVVHCNKQVIEICGSDVRVLGIYGIGGVGKTTLAKVVYNRIYDLFQGYSNLQTIQELRQDDILSLQTKLISELQKRSARFECSHDAMEVLANGFRNKQVLILLDDINDVDQLNAVVGELSWFGPGSRIIVTSRKSDILLKFKEAAKTYEVESMDEDKALQLFSKHAFQRDSPNKGFESLSWDIVSAIGRLPLALEVIGASLFQKAVGVWKDTLQKLKNDPNEKVEHKLKISYEALDIYAKQIFLDIACFLTGKDWRIASYMWEDCKLYPSSGIGALLVMSLVKIGENNELVMHDLLRTLGRKIVLNEDPIPRYRSRLWVHNEALSTLQEKEGTAKVQALALTFHEGSDECFTSDEFGPLPNLRFLILDQANMRGNFMGLLLELRWLHWRGCHKSFEPLVLNLENLVILDLSWSVVTDDWEGWPQIMEKAKKLKVLELTGCSQLSKTPCFPADSKLERLILEKCPHLSLIDKSIGNLKYLEFLNIKYTPILQLPEEMGSLGNLEELLIDETFIGHLGFARGSMQQLKNLSASGCKNLADLSESIGSLRSLSCLVLDKAIISRLPNSIKLLEGIIKLSLRDCQRITTLPDSVGMLKSLQKMDLSNTRVQILPESIKNLNRLEVLKMKNTRIRKFPKDITNLEKLEVITFSGCPLNGEIPSDISGLSSLRILKLSFTLIVSLPESICQLSCLQTLHLLHCDELWTLPKLPSSLLSLRWGTKNMRMVQDFSYLRDLKVLELVNEPDKEEISAFELSQMESLSWISSLSNLKTLKLCLPNVTSLPKDFHALTQLKKLDLSSISQLDFPQLPSSLSRLLIKNCKSQWVNFSNLETLSELELCDCDAWEILGLGNLRLLQVLKISGCNIRNLDGLEQASLLRRFSMSNCYSLNRLPDLSNCASLEIKEIDFCNIQDQPRYRHYESCCSRRCDCPYQYQHGG